eukprot:COSAG04_NODE_1295_length_7328_cov_9.809241_2_plen_167_part_00
MRANNPPVLLLSLAALLLDRLTPPAATLLFVCCADYEYPTAREIFLNGRADEDRGFELDEPLPPWAADGTAGLAPTRPPTGEGVGENVSRLDGAVEDATSEVAVAIRALAEGSAAPDSEVLPRACSPTLLLPPCSNLSVVVWLQALAGRLREVVAPLLEELRSAKL